MPLPALGAVFGWGFLISVIPTIIGHVLKGVGFGLVAFTGSTIAINYLEEWVFNKFDGLAVDVFQILVIMNLDTGITMVFSAMTLRITMMSSVSAVRAVWRKPGQGFGGGIDA
ncbi:DUF2523 domain-containing protein [Kistimonas asteriae]|uniref:DUF2523 domain-containing protein n=1 Tax=Kistimonas asteriae TaxID=517724 RepID=UPI001BA5F28C|nr:DUF2523 domain-containing protein [Kistimonas asteriae]